MSFSNDEEGDGLAALFGGVTPAAAAPGDPGPRRAAQAPAPAAPAEPAPGAAPSPHEAPAAPAPRSGWSSAAPSQYPGLAPAASQPPAPASYSPPAPASLSFPSYAPPAPAEPTAPPSYGAPAAPSSPAPSAPAYEMPAPAQQGPQSYDLPPPASAPSAPAWSPEPTPPPTAPQSSDPQPPPPFGSHQYERPQAPTYYETPQPPAQFETPHPPPQFETPRYEAPQEPPRYDLPAPEGAQYLGGALTSPAYPPTAQYPAALDIPAPFPSAPPQGAAYAPPVADPPSYAPPAGPGYELPAATPAPLEEPPPFVAPPLGYEAYARPSAYAEPQPDVQPVAPSPGEHPLVLSEPALPATVFPPGPLLPSSTAAVTTPEYLERSTAMEKVGLVLALLTGPIGLGVAIANAARSARRRGWLIGIVRASLVLGVLSTIAAGIAGYVYWNVRADQIAHAEVVAASAEFCAAADADPTMVTPPTLGWPAQGASVGESITLMQAWTDRWATLAPGAPPKLGTGIELLAETGQTIVDGVTTARVVDDASNQAQIAAAAGQSGVAAWYTKYCVAP